MPQPCATIDTASRTLAHTYALNVRFLNQLYSRQLKVTCFLIYEEQSHTGPVKLYVRHYPRTSLTSFTRMWPQIGSNYQTRLEQSPIRELDELNATWHQRSYKNWNFQINIWHPCWKQLILRGKKGKKKDIMASISVKRIRSGRERKYASLFCTFFNQKYICIWPTFYFFPYLKSLDDSNVKKIKY